VTRYSELPFDLLKSARNLRVPYLQAVGGTAEASGGPLYQMIAATSRERFQSTNALESELRVNLLSGILIQP